MALQCEAAGCDEAGFACYLQYWDDEPNGVYCGAHAAENGFCCVCGVFWAGIESFDFLHPGICDNCYQDVRDE